MAYNKYRRHDRDIMLRRNKEILRMRSEGATLVETGENFGVTGERVRQIESEAQGETNGPRKRKPAATKRAAKPGIKRGSGAATKSAGTGSKGTNSGGTKARKSKTVPKTPTKRGASTKSSAANTGSSRRSASDTVRSAAKAPANARKPARKAKSSRSRIRSGAGSLRQSAKPARKQPSRKRA